ncbi:MAG: diguanylate cyclase [Actinobacteria bacterium]|jgi:diguanylate cyclase (GGDEF)-like protein/PAS domain S-box-containing protein|nr:diguanylate cyclase [Actinomycetota bacterium]
MADAEWDRTLSRLPDGTLRRRAEHETAGALVATALLLAAAKKAAEQLAAARLVAAQRATADDLSDRDRVAARESAPISEATGEFSRQEITAAGAAGDLAIAHADAAEELAAAHADAAEELAAAARTAAERLAEAHEDAAKEHFLAEEQFRFFMDWSGVAGCTVSAEGRFLRVNRALCELLGSSEDELLGATLQSVTHPDDVGVLVALVGDLVAGERSSFRTLSRYLASDGRVVWGDLSVAAALNSDGTIAFQIAQILDVTERVDHEAALAAMATHDSLTGLANRAAILDEAARALSAQTRTGRSTAVLVVDLDHFKNVNDQLGHTAGDELLQAAATRIESITRAGDVAARPGGDEFVIVMRDLDTAADAVRAAWRLVEAFRHPFVVAGREFYATASIGIAIAADTTGVGFALKAGDLLREADSAMYAAKAEGRDRVSVYNEELREIVSARLAIESDLRHALERGQLAVWYQPEVELATGAVIAVEALLR